MIVFKWIVVVVAAYLLGSIPTGIMLAKMQNVDIRSQGSKSSGATNMFRVIGAKASILTFLGDCLKGTLASLIGFLLLGKHGAYVAGVLVVFGHLYPIFAGFRGGKGVSTALGTSFVINWWLGLALFAYTIVGVAFTKVVSIFTITSLMFFGIVNPFLCQGDVLCIICSILIGGLVVFAHRSNIVRIFNGTEFNNKLNFKKK